MLVGRYEYPATSVADTSAAGDWRITVRTSRGATDITQVRGAVTQIQQVTWTDPFGPATAVLQFPNLSLLDAPGQGDLHWWRPGADVDIVWSAQGYATGLVRTELRWEGYLAAEAVSLSDGGGRVELTCKGALRMADNTVLMPEYPQRPWPFEYAIEHALDRCRAANGYRFGKMRVEWPEGWDLRYMRDPDANWWMEPLRVRNGDLWSGMVTRETGTGDQALTSYIAGLLTSMHTERGMFTLMLDDGRIPVLRFRPHTGSRHTAAIDAVAPGFAYDGSNDYEARTDAVFGSGRGLDGIAFSNMQFDAARGTAFYLPFAHNPRQYPASKTDPLRLRRDVKLDFYDGLSQRQADEVAEQYRRRFATSGHTGTVTLSTDPWLAMEDGTVVAVPRHTLVAGDRLRVYHFRGTSTGALLHISEVEHNLESGTTTLQVDTQVRDYMTTEEMRLRGRDALTSSMSLTTGQYNVSVRDQMLPWGPESGYLPVKAEPLFSDTAMLPTGDISDYQFPWDAMTASHPPKDPLWESCYVKIPAAGPDLAKNWNRPSASHPATLMLLSQAGTAQLIQIMAVDRDGARMRVPFHVSFYLNESTSAGDMPKLNNRGYDIPLWPGVTEGPYPFFPGAWESINKDGSLPNDRQFVVPAEGAGPVGSYGTHDAPAGYWPGYKPDGDIPTGMLVIEDGFSWDIANFDKDFNPYDASKNSFETAGIFGVMIYCDGEWDEATGAVKQRERDVYFIGRVFRKPPGNS